MNLKIIRSNNAHKKSAVKAKNMGIYLYHQEVVKLQKKMNRLLTKTEKESMYKYWAY